MQFNAYSSCLKCIVNGTYYHKQRRISFAHINLRERTDADFRKRVDPDHHKTDSPLERLPIDMVTDIVTSDPLHLLHLGIIKRLMSGWITGKLGFNAKWSSTDIEQISEYLLEYELPSEINRSVRTLDAFSFWKGAEFRVILHYIGPVLFEKHLKTEVYNNFMLLFCGVTICSSGKYKGYLHIAKLIFDEFIETYINLYGEHSITSNVHNVSHIVGDVTKFGTLESISTYPFENMLGRIQTLLRQRSKPLEQTAKRIIEKNNVARENKLIINDVRDIYSPYKLISEIVSDGGEKKYSAIVCGKFRLSHGFSNKWFLTRSKEIVAMQYAYFKSNKYFICSKKLTRQVNWFETPIKSSYLNIFLADTNDFSSENIIIPIEDIKCKLVAIKRCKDVFVFMPLMHTL